MKSASSLAGKHAVVTGAGRGIGAAVVRALAEQGACLTLMGRSAANLQRTAVALPAGSQTRTQTVDVMQPEAVQQAFVEASEAFGPVAILVNNAGQAHSAPFAKTDLAAWRRMLDVNLTGPYLCTQAVLPAMLQLDYARLINIASTAALTGYRYVSAYCAAKHGVLGLTRALALEVAKSAVTVNAVCPGFTDTDMVTEAVGNISRKTGMSLEQARAELTRSNPQGRLVSAEDVAATVLWLCSPQAQAINGQAIAVCGGEVM